MSNKIKVLAKQIRKDVLNMTHDARCSHIGSCLSIADIMAVLYGEVMRCNPNQPDWDNRDRFILSKGHACGALYAVLAECGYFPNRLLGAFYQKGSLLAGHAYHKVPGVDVSTGSLGHGLSIGCGMALRAKKDGLDYKVFVLLGDGDCQEGSTWESAMFAGHHKLDNLVAIVDYNKLQALGNTESILDLAPLSNKWRAFGWWSQEIDGHNLEEIEEALKNTPEVEGYPTCIIANTIKGEGVRVMQNDVSWHYKYPDDDELILALKEIGCAKHL